MPYYIFCNPNKPEEIKEVFQRMDDDHSHEENGIKWQRVFTVSQAAIDTKWDANSPQDFVEKSAQKVGTYGDLVDKSKELSERRERIFGKDPIREKSEENYRKNHRGQDPPHIKREKLKSYLDSKGFELSE